MGDSGGGVAEPQPAAAAAPAASWELVVVETGELNTLPPLTGDARTQLTAITGVAGDDQILLSDAGEKLNHHALRSAPAAAARVYIFNRRVLGAASAPKLVSYDLSEIAVPDSASLKYSAAATSSPAIAVIQTYERTFLLQCDQAKAISDACALRGHFAANCSAHARHQADGMRVAIANLNSHTEQIRSGHASHRAEQQCMWCGGRSRKGSGRSRKDSGMRVASIGPPPPLLNTVSQTLVRLRNTCPQVGDGGVPAEVPGRDSQAL